MAKEKFIRLRVTDTERDKYKRVAKAAGKSNISELLRSYLERLAKKHKVEE